MLAIMRGPSSTPELKPVQFKAPTSTEPAFDFALLRQPARPHASRHRMALLWLLGLLLLLVGAVVTLVLYLNNFEDGENQRQRAADAQWLEQSAQFNFRRLEDDLEDRIAELSEQEEIAAIRPELDGQQIMKLLGLAPGREVGAAYNFLLELRLNEGPLGEEEATRRLRAWWSAR